MVIRAVYFVFIARALGPEGYGAFAAVTALVAIASPFAGWGGGDLLIRDVARGTKSFHDAWGKALLVVLLSGSILVGIVISSARLLLPGTIPMMLVVAVALSDLFFLRVIDTGAQAYQAFERLDRTAIIRASPSLLRLVGAAAVLPLFGSASPQLWGWIYLATTVISAVGTVCTIQLELGSPVFKIGEVLTDWKDGFLFALSLSAQSIYNDIDKSMLARLSTLDATGIYAAAYRLVAVAVTPVRSILYAAYARFFQHGAQGIGGSVRYARRLLPVGLASAFLPAILLFLSAPLIPQLLGEDYASAVDAIRWLAFLPVLKAGNYFAADALTGAGKQGVRSAIQIAVAAVNVLLNIWLIPEYSWRGTAIASLVSDALLTMSLWVAVWYLSRISVGKSVGLSVSPG